MCLLLLFTGKAFGATWILNEDGLLIGASDINVNGTLYEVSFRDGTLSGIFGDASGLDTDNLELAVAFSQALLDQVFVNNELGNFDTDPELTFGCPNTQGCFIFTPYSVEDLIVTSVGAINRHNVVNPDMVRSEPPLSSGIDSDFSEVTTWVYGDWEMQEIPLPAAGWLFLSALVGLAYKKRLIKH